MITREQLLDVAIDDDRITSKTELRVLRFAYKEMDSLLFQRVKAETIAVNLRKSRPLIVAALQKFEALGYIERGPADAKGVATYRLPRLLPSPVAADVVASAPRQRVRFRGFNP